MEFETKQIRIFEKIPYYFLHDDHIGKCVSENHWWELPTSQVFVDYFYPRRDEEFIFIDVGAHCGYFSVLCAGICPKATIYAFEPNLRNYKVLLMNSKMYPGIIPLQYAIDDKCYVGNLVSDLGDTGGNQITPIIRNYEHGYTEEPCLVKDLAYFKFDYNRVKFIKIDSQANEEQIAKNVTKDLHPGTIVCVEVFGGPEWFKEDEIKNRYGLMEDPTGRDRVYYNGNIFMIKK